LQLNFRQQDIITSDYELNGRFGIALSKIGDINLDGFNDIAISAPFEGNGAVYIHLGSENGISQKPSQRLQAPSELVNPYDQFATSWFGHGVSRGVDIDHNGYKDIAIGSPNAESVYIFKSYPVVKVVATITTSKSEISLDDNQFSMKLCAHIESARIVDFDIGE